MSGPHRVFVDVVNRARKFPFVAHYAVVEARFPQASRVPEASDLVASYALEVLHDSADFDIPAKLHEGVYVIGHDNVGEYCGTLLVTQPSECLNYGVSRRIDQDGSPAPRGGRYEVDGAVDVEAAKGLALAEAGGHGWSLAMGDGS